MWLNENKNSNEWILKIENFKKYYKLHGKENLYVQAVNNINFKIYKGETLGLVGESGCGKTTVAKCITMLLKQDRGKIIFNNRGREVDLNENISRSLRFNIQMVFQDPFTSLNPRFNVKKILEDPLINKKGSGRHEIVKKIEKTLELVELDHSYLEKYPIELTQGEQQRVGIARAFITDPELVVLDEPTSLLDIHFRAEIVNLLRKIQKERETSYLFITHDLVVVSQLSKRILVMYLGRIVEEGETEDVFSSPLHPYTKALFSAALFPDPLKKTKAINLKGEVPSPVNLPDNRCNLYQRCPMATDICLKSLPKLKEVKKGRFVACFYCN